MSGIPVSKTSGRRKSLASAMTNKQQTSTSLTAKARRRTIAGVNLDKENGANSTASTRRTPVPAAKLHVSPAVESPGGQESRVTQSATSKTHKSPFHHHSKTKLPEVAMGFFKIKTPKNNASFETASPNGSFLNDTSFLSMASSNSSSSGSDSDPLNVSAMSDTTGFSSAQFVAQLSSRQKSKAFRKEGRRSAQFVKQLPQKFSDGLLPCDEQMILDQPKDSIPMANSRPPLNTMHTSSESPYRRSTISHEAPINKTTTRRSGEFHAAKTRELISTFKQQTEKRRPRLSTASTNSNASEISFMQAELRGLGSPVIEGNQIIKRRKSGASLVPTGLSSYRRETANTSDLALLGGSDDSTVNTSDLAHLNISREGIVDSNSLRSSKGVEMTSLSIQTSNKGATPTLDPMDETVDASTFDLFSEEEGVADENCLMVGERYVSKKVLPVEEKDDAPKVHANGNLEETPSPPQVENRSAIENFEGDSTFDLRSPVAHAGPAREGSELNEDTSAITTKQDTNIAAETEESVQNMEDATANTSDLNLWASSTSLNHESRSRRSTMSIKSTDSLLELRETSPEKTEDSSVMDKSLADAQAAARTLFESSKESDQRETDGDANSPRRSSVNLSRSSTDQLSSPKTTVDLPGARIDRNLISSPARNTRLQARRLSSSTGKSAKSSMVDSPARNTRLQNRLVDPTSTEKIDSSMMNSPARNIHHQARLSSSKESASSKTGDSPAKNTRLQIRLSSTTSSIKNDASGVIDSPARNTRLQARLARRLHLNDETSPMEDSVNSPPIPKRRKSSLVNNEAFGKSSVNHESLDIVAPLPGVDPNSSFSSLQLKSSIRKSNRPRLSGSARVAFGSPQTLHFNKNSPPMSATPNPSRRKNTFEEDTVEIEQDMRALMKSATDPSVAPSGIRVEPQSGQLFSEDETEAGIEDDDGTIDLNDTAEDNPTVDDSDMVDSPTMSVHGTNVSKDDSQEEEGTICLEDNLALMMAQQGGEQQADQKERESTKMEETQELEARLSNVLEEEASVVEFSRKSFETGDAISKRTWSQTFLQNNDENTVQLESNMIDLLGMPNGEEHEIASSKRSKTNEIAQLSDAETDEERTEGICAHEQCLTLTVNDILPLFSHQSGEAEWSDSLLSFCELFQKSSTGTVHDSIFGFLEHVLSHLDFSKSYTDMGSDYFEKTDERQKYQLVRLQETLKSKADDVRGAIDSATLSVARKQKSAFARWLGESIPQLVGAANAVTASLREVQEKTMTQIQNTETQIQKLRDIKDFSTRRKARDAKQEKQASLREQIVVKKEQIEEARTKKQASLREQILAKNSWIGETRGKKQASLRGLITARKVGAETASAAWRIFRGMSFLDFSARRLQFQSNFFSAEIQLDFLEEGSSSAVKRRSLGNEISRARLARIEFTGDSGGMTQGVNIKSHLQKQVEDMSLHSEQNLIRLCSILTNLDARGAELLSILNKFEGVTVRDGFLLVGSGRDHIKIQITKNHPYERLELSNPPKKNTLGWNQLIRQVDKAMARKL